MSVSFLWYTTSWCYTKYYGYRQWLDYLPSFVEIKFFDQYKRMLILWNVCYVEYFLTILYLLALSMLWINMLWIEYIIRKIFIDVIEICNYYNNEYKRSMLNLIFLFCPPDMPKNGTSPWSYSLVYSKSSQQNN